MPPMLPGVQVEAFFSKEWATTSYYRQVIRYLTPADISVVLYHGQVQLDPKEIRSETEDQREERIREACLEVIKSDKLGSIVKDPRLTAPPFMGLQTINIGRILLGLLRNEEIAAASLTLDGLYTSTQFIRLLVHVNAPESALEVGPKDSIRVIGQSFELDGSMSFQLYSIGNPVKQEQTISTVEAGSLDWEAAITARPWQVTIQIVTWATQRDPLIQAFMRVPVDTPSALEEGHLQIISEGWDRVSGIIKKLREKSYFEQT
ncbi:uncharacterized protein N7518_007836 [Penicillium psychrosexuale]|uniref:uncharacterized protein n=1 Tax=Penicillium psychrosexuale TaxID=1002107 RepID=UPI0025450FD5|nr:uncharacterized protein N7518_007836 [Penicillium psychrosexuale]KAJ5790825.1 hypothetical protein N7518_007836 [Penicillium psychrosexuale]